MLHDRTVNNPINGTHEKPLRFAWKMRKYFSFIASVTKEKRMTIEIFLWGTFFK